jgi:ankyrin repeat protein
VACQLNVDRALRAKLEPAALAVIDALLEAKADVNAAHANSEYPPLVAAIRWATPAIVKRLLEARPKVHESMVLDAVQHGQFECVQPLMMRAGGVDRTALLRALCAHGTQRDDVAQLARTLCKLNANPNHAERDGATPTHWAAYWTDVPMLLVLIEAGADMNAPLASNWYPNESKVLAGSTPRTLLDRALGFAAERWADGHVESRAEWEKLASALGTTVEQWLSDAAAQRAQAPAKKPRKTKAK